MNFYYEPKNYDTIFVTLDQVKYLLKAGGADTLLQEMQNPGGGSGPMIN